MLLFESFDSLTGLLRVEKELSTITVTVDGGFIVIGADGSYKIMSDIENVQFVARVETLLLEYLDMSVSSEGDWGSALYNILDKLTPNNSEVRITLSPRQLIDFVKYMSDKELFYDMICEEEDKIHGDDLEELNQALYERMNTMRNIEKAVKGEI